MVDLAKSKPVRRRAVILLDNRIEPRPGDWVTVTLDPHGVISFKPAHRRVRYDIPIETVYRMAVRAHVAAERRR